MKMVGKRDQKKNANKTAGKQKLLKTKSLSPEQQTTAIQQSINLGIQHHARGDLPKAEGIYREVLQIQPNQPVALHLLGLIAHQVGENNIAIDLIGKSLVIQPDDAEAHNNLGVVFSELNKLDEAITSYHKALAIKPDYSEAHFNLGNTLKDLGELEKAAESFLTALATEPNNTEIHNNLGVVLNKLNKLDEAAASFHNALAIQPDNAEAHNNLGVTLSEQDKQEEAIASFQNALAVNPDYAETHFNLGNALRKLNELDEATACFHNALAIKPNYAEAHNNLGDTLKDRNKLDEAVTHFHKALAIKPEYAEAQNNLGIAFQDMGMLEEAVAKYRKAIEINPDYSKAYKNLAYIKQHTKYDEEVQAMENKYSMPDIDDQQRMYLAFGLGKAFEDLCQYEKAFGYFADGNAIKRRSLKYSIDDTINFSKRVKEVFDTPLFAKHQSAGCDDRTPIFILGMPRSGTSLVEQILASHPQVYGAGELATLGQSYYSYFDKQSDVVFPDSIRQLDTVYFEQPGIEYIQALRKHSLGLPFITDKMPGNFKHIGLIKLMLPNAKVIHCRRDPADTCLSIFKTHFIDNHEYSYDLGELAHYYNFYSDLMEHWNTVIPGFIYDVQYENMVADQTNQTVALLEHCNLKWDDACLDFHKTDRQVKTASAAQVRRPIYKNSVQLWKHYELQLAPLLNFLR